MINKNEMGRRKTRILGSIWPFRHGHWTPPYHFKQGSKYLRVKILTGRNKLVINIDRRPCTNEHFRLKFYNKLSTLYEMPPSPRTSSNHILGVMKFYRLCYFITVCFNEILRVKCVCDILKCTFLLIAFHTVTKYSQIYFLQIQCF